MLQTIHDKLKGIFAVAILVALGIVFVFWGVNFSTDIGGFSKAKGIEVNGREIAIEEVQRDYQEQMSRVEAAMGESGVPEEMRRAIQQRVVDQAVQMELVRQRTLKLDFEATDAEILETIQSIPAFQVEGRFSKDAYQAALRNINLTPDRFEAEQRQFVLARQLDRGIEGSAFVLPSELQRQVALRSEMRALGWVTVQAREFESAAVVDDAAIQKYYEANAPRYMTEEQATVDFVELDIDAFAAEASVTEENLRQYYEENKARYTRPGRRHARHILFEAGNDEKASEEKARRAYERAKAGEDFGALARELSDDTGSKGSGGDLGESERSVFVGPFGDAVWSMTPGEIRGPVKTEFGWHVIKLESVTPETTQGFEEVRAELEPEFRRSQVEKAFGEAQEELDTRAFEAAGDIAAVAAQLKLPLKRVERYTRSGSAELGATPKVTEAVFSPDVLAGRELRTVELEPGKVIALGVKAHEPSKAKPLEEVRSEVTESARLEAAAKLAAARAGEIVAELGKGAAWPAAIAKWKTGDGTQDPKAMGRNDAAAPAEVLAAAFRAPAPGSGPRYGVATLANGDTAIWTVTSAEKGSFAALSPDAQQAAREDARNRAAMSDATVYVTSMRANAEIDVNSKLFE